MTESRELDRREFHQWTVAAFSGLAAGLTLGCGGTPTPPAGGPAPATLSTTATTPTGVELSEAEQLILDEPHVCRGLNGCKGLGRSKENTCAGMGTCASIVDHSCGGQNECKGQGGCGTNPGMNSCKGQGGCHIPLMDDAWTTARAAFEAAMKKTGKEVGAAPAKS
jgi:hypothetical protein